MAVVDAYDSLTHVRVYRPAMPEGEALEIIRHGDGKDFDPEVLAVFLDNLPVIREIVALHPDKLREETDAGTICLPGGMAALAAPVLA